MAEKICIGTGLVSLDILVRENEKTPISFKTGGTCGNVMMILSYMGWDSYPVARLDCSENTSIVLDEMKTNGVHTDFITISDSGSTPVIIQHNTTDIYGNPTHSFSFKSGYFDFKPITKKDAIQLLDCLSIKPSVFFFDRVNAATVVMSEFFKKNGVLVYFEATSKRCNKTQFEECVNNSDIIKFSNQQITDTRFVNSYKDKLFIETMGTRGLRFNLLGKGWNVLPAHLNNEIKDSSGAGDWTSATFINEIIENNITNINELDLNKTHSFLEIAQIKASESCLYEGARGLMEKNKGQE